VNKFLLNLIVTVFISLIFISSALAKEYIAKVLSNHDGDTLTVMLNGKKEKVRLLGIDTAEIQQQGEWGNKAKDFTRKITKGKNIKLITDVQERDQYGRVLAYVYVDGIFLNQELIKQGYAMLLTYAPNVKYAGLLKETQTKARESGAGIWNQNSGLKETPYEYRHKDKKKNKRKN
jgi:micrococcal nuclease